MGDSGHTGEALAADRALSHLDGFAQWAIAAGGRIAARFRSWPWWVQVGVVWLLGRIFTLGWTMVALAHQPSLAALPHLDGYFDYASIWDGGYYRRIHDEGYPSALPMAADGSVAASQWAFLPVYPFVVRAVTALTGIAWPVAATSVSALACLGFLLVGYRLFRLHQDHASALFAVAAISFATAAPVLQFAYAESLAFLCVAAVLLLISHHRYLLAAPLVVIAALTRPLGAPLLGLTLVVAVVEVVQARRAGLDRRSWRLGSLSVLVLAGVVAAVAWPLIAGWVTGVPNAYLATEAAWRAGYLLGPLEAFSGSLLAIFGPAAVVIGVVAILGLAAVMLSRPVRRLGIVVWTWVGMVLGYLVLVAPVSTSLPRLSGAAFPLAAAAIGVSKSRAYRWLLVLVLAATQVGYLMILWRISDGIHDQWP
jgi:hypothetical protein